MKRIPSAVVASILAATALCSPAPAAPPSLPYRAHVAAPPPLLLPVRYRRHRHDPRHYASRDEATGAQDGADDSAIKAGEWEFAAQLEAAALPMPGTASMPGTGAAAGGGMKSTYAICVAADKAVPSAFVAGCKLDAVHRDGGRITWSMTCTNRQNAVRSDGVAQYNGDTMSATMLSHLPSAKAGGKTTEVAQRITGHYLRPCPTPPTTTAAASATSGTAAATAATPPASAPTGAAAPYNAAAQPAATQPASAPAEAAKPSNAAAQSAATPPASAATEGAASNTAAPKPAAAPPASAPAAGPASAAAEPEATTAAPTQASEPRQTEEHEAHHRRYRRYHRHYAYRRRYHRNYGGGFYGNGTYSGFGPNPYSASGY